MSNDKYFKAKLVMRPNAAGCWYKTDIKIWYACEVESLKRCMRRGSATRRQFKRFKLKSSCLLHGCSFILMSDIPFQKKDSGSSAGCPRHSAAVRKVLSWVALRRVCYLHTTAGLYEQDNMSLYNVLHLDIEWWRKLAKVLNVYRHTELCLYRIRKLQRSKAS